MSQALGTGRTRPAPTRSSWPCHTATTRPTLPCQTAQRRIRPRRTATVRPPRASRRPTRRSCRRRCPWMRRLVRRRPHLRLRPFCSRLRRLTKHPAAFSRRRRMQRRRRDWRRLWTRPLLPLHAVELSSRRFLMHARPPLKFSRQRLPRPPCPPPACRPQPASRPSPCSPRPCPPSPPLRETCQGLAPWLRPRRQPWPAQTMHPRRERSVPPWLLPQPPSRSHAATCPHCEPWPPLPPRLWPPRVICPWPARAPLPSRPLG
mmetsp:Transcript_16321/g.52111  ORF Transcript_16321/g.52111 Transcript_16321/m.52111 type:complete len:261 (+) Transcript_16321:532-1314(+)